MTQFGPTVVAYSGSASPVVGSADCAVVDLTEAGVVVERRSLKSPAPTA